MRWSRWCLSHLPAFNRTLLVRSFKQLPDLDECEQFADWYHWFHTRKDRFTFKRYTPRIGQHQLCKTRFNSIDELLTTLLSLRTAIKNNKTFRLQVVSSAHQKEYNLDYFLTDKLHRPYEITTVYERMHNELDELKRITNMFIHSEDDRKTYYARQLNPLLGDIAMVMVSLIAVSDQFLPNLK